MISIEEVFRLIDNAAFVVNSLGEIEDNGILSLGRGQIISKKEMQSTPGNYPVYSSSAVGDGEIGRYGKYMFDDERITWSIDGGGKLFYRNHLCYSVTNVGGWIKINDAGKLNTKYLFYCLLNQWEKKTFDYTKKAHPSVIRNEYVVPLLPIRVQEVIAETLDCFEDLIHDISSEIDMRTKQFEYYGDLLMSKQATEYYLEDVCDIIDCPHTSPKWKTSGIPVIRNYNLVRGAIDMSKLSYVDEQEYTNRTKRVIPKQDDILFSREAPIGNVGIIPEGFKCCQGQRVVLLRPYIEKVYPKFLLYVLQSKAVRLQTAKAESVGSTVSNFNIGDLKKLKVNIPDDKERQMELIDQLDLISSLCSDLEYGLPAELNARNKQYRFFRELIFAKCMEVANENRKKY